MSFPEELRNFKQWVCWKWVERKGKKTKPPFQPNGQFAKNNDPATWSWFADLSGDKVGFVFSSEDPFIGIDLDGCRNPDSGVIDDWAMEVIRTLGTYAEISPSGTGVKLWGVTDLRDPWPHRNVIDLPADKYGQGYGDKKPGIEVYVKERYFAVTGQALAERSRIINVDDHLEWLAERFGMMTRETPQDTTSSATSPKPPKDEHAKAALNAMRKIHPNPGESDGSKRLLNYARQAKRWGLYADQAVTMIRAMLLECPLPQGVTYTDAEIAKRYEQADVTFGEAIEHEPENSSKPEGKTSARQTTIKTAAEEYLAQLASGRKMLIDTGVPELDYSIGGGVAPGEMMILAARPSHGKSLVALQMVHFMSKTEKALVISEEMSALAIGKRAIQFVSATPEEHWAKQQESVLGDVHKHFKDRNDPLIRESCGNIDNVIRECENAIANDGVTVIAVDYIQLIQGKGNNRYEQVSQVSQRLRQMANEHNVLVIVLAQLNREIERRSAFVPVNADLKDTGQLEQDADVVVFGVWPHRIDSKIDPHKYQFFVGKNRNRAINQSAFDVTIEPSRQRLTESIPEPHEEFDDYASDWHES